MYESKLYETYADADKAVERLHALGFGQDAISVVVNPDQLPDADKQMGNDGAAVGGALGAILAAAVAIGATGGAAAPLVAGPLVALLAGSAGVGLIGGSIFGGLLELGLQADDVRNALDHGGVLVAVKVASDDERAKVKAAL
jgi:hypothetical protein